jgi:hypothetical protein
MGPFLDISYYPGGDPSPGMVNLEGTSLVAINGRLICACSWGCTFRRTYFEVATTEETALYIRLLRERSASRSKASR